MAFIYGPGFRVKHAPAVAPLVATTYPCFLKYQLPGPNQALGIPQWLGASPLPLTSCNSCA